MHNLIMQSSIHLLPSTAAYDHPDSCQLMLTSTCDCASASVILLLPVLEVLVGSKGGFSGLGVGLGATPQDEGGPLPEGRFTCPKPALALITQLVEEALCAMVRVCE